jgi:hypothetical protein
MSKHKKGKCCKFERYNFITNKNIEHNLPIKKTKKTKNFKHKKQRSNNGSGDVPFSHRM